MLQQQVLSKIVRDLIGDRRLPYLVLDSSRVLKDCAMFSARGAGILGFSIFGKDRCFALDERMEPDFDAVEAFLHKHTGEKILVFGFTYILWKQFIRRLEEQGRTISIPEGILIHGGGWKKLAAEAVSREELKERICRVTGIRHVHEYYGMAEQTGCIYIECECGHLHSSVWSDILVRRPSDYSLCETGEQGILQVMTPIARSYPGHNLLTEDLGTILGEDDCPCGRLGKYFSVSGRIPKAEVRGCSDTFEGVEEVRGNAAGTDGRKGAVPEEEDVLPGEAAEKKQSGHMTNRTEEGSFGTEKRACTDEDVFRIGREAELLAGSHSPRPIIHEIFAGEVIDFLDALSQAVRKDTEARSYPEIAAFGFWCRCAHMEDMKKRYIPAVRGNVCQTVHRLGRGMAFHLAPANVPAMFAYSLAIGLLAGNSNIVRVSSRTGQIGDILCRLIRQTLCGDLNKREVKKGNLEKQDFFSDSGDSFGREGACLCESEKQGSVTDSGDSSGRERACQNDFVKQDTAADPFASIREGTAIIRYDRDDALTHRMMENADVRVVWGGDETVRKMRMIPARPGAVEEFFPDRWSLSLISINALRRMTDEEVAVQARRFFNDTYIMDQRGCSSPQLVLLREDDPAFRESGADDFTPENAGSAEQTEGFINKNSGTGDEPDRFWKAVASIAREEYEWDAYKAARKFEQYSLFLLKHGNADTHLRSFEGNLLQVIRMEGLAQGNEQHIEYRGGFGLFYEARIRSLEELLPFLDPKAQTLTCIGVDREAVADFLISRRACGIDRIVPVGQALQMDTVWDGRDLIAEMSRIVDL